MDGRAFRRRSGLAPLELVLALPILLFVMALMVNFGIAACWKIRALSMARQAVWGMRPPRTGNTDPRPGYWPKSASVRTGGPEDVPELDDPRVDQPVARGPLPAAIVDNELLDPTRGLRSGTAEITRRYAMLGRMGNYHLNAVTRLLDDKWQYWRMEKLGANRKRRVPVIYDLAKAPAALVNAYVQAAIAVRNAYFGWPGLLPLDREPDYAYYGRLLGWGTSAPDFQPTLSGFCTLDHDAAAAVVERLVDRIQGKIELDSRGNVIRRIPNLAERMTGSFKSFYQRVKRQCESMLEMEPVPPPGPGVLRSEIRQLDIKIRQLD
ncbi:MAG TPA: TadE family protein [Thermoguttaceae bacterium]|nr:TadE family protein [Thermoguttaceae bacterium]